MRQAGAIRSVVAPVGPDDDADVRVTLTFCAGASIWVLLRIDLRAGDQPDAAYYKQQSRCSATHHGSRIDIQIVCPIVYILVQIKRAHSEPDQSVRSNLFKQVCQSSNAHSSPIMVPPKSVRAWYPRYHVAALPFTNYLTPRTKPRPRFSLRFDIALKASH